MLLADGRVASRLERLRGPGPSSVRGEAEPGPAVDRLASQGRKLVDSFDPFDVGTTDPEYLQPRGAETLGRLSEGDPVALVLELVGVHRFVFLRILPHDLERPHAVSRHRSYLAPTWRA